ncbi:hypothetical protein F5Y05DRAFT_303793 [Hypoxylon sp. FL0543]|nr:hypothetical protein F5Y05DRAFT_303793 [Hypoxylon sp. FL0543]
MACIIPCSSLGVPLRSWALWLSAFHMADAMRDSSYTTQREASFSTRSTRVGLLIDPDVLRLAHLRLGCKHSQQAD